MIRRRSILAFCIFCLVFLNANTCGKKEASSGGAGEAAAVEVEVPEPEIKTMYVNALDGLRVRNAPTDGDVITTLAYSTEITVLEEEENSVTIGGVTGKWALIKTDSIQGWAFGGFLSEQFPSDTSFLIGTWRDSDDQQTGRQLAFESNRFTSSWLGGGPIVWGTWKLEANILTLHVQEGGAYERTQMNVEEVYTLTVGNRNNITLRRQGGRPLNLRKM